MHPPVCQPPTLFATVATAEITRGKSRDALDELGEKLNVTVYTDILAFDLESFLESGLSRFEKSWT